MACKNWTGRPGGHAFGAIAGCEKWLLLPLVALVLFVEDIFYAVVNRMRWSTKLRTVTNPSRR